MAVVIADTSPVNYLILIGEIELLPSLYGRIVLPDIVLRELRDPGTPAPVAIWAMALPDWIEVVPAPADNTGISPLDPGERAAISLARSYGDRTETFLLMDDSAGRVEAARLGLQVTGTLGILRAASIKQLTDIESALDRLSQTNFYLPSRLAAFLRAEARSRSRAVRPQ